MPVTLAQAKLNAVDDISTEVIDEFRKESVLLEAMTFDDVVNPGGSGSTLTYGYTRLLTQPTAAFRAINAEYTPQEVTKARVTVDLKPLGGSFQIDRVLDQVAAGAETALQISQKVKAAKTLFADAMINGDTAVDANSFDGLKKALAGSTTEMNPTGPITDWTAATTEDVAFGRLDVLDQLLATVDGGVTFIIANKLALAKVRGAARRAHLVTVEDEQLLNSDIRVRIERYGGVVLVDPGQKAGLTTDIIPIEAQDPDGAGAIPSTPGLTDIYAVRFGLDGFHGISTVGGELVHQWLPDFSVAGAVKTGEVELGPVAVALKATKAAAVLKHVKVV